MPTLRSFAPALVLCALFTHAQPPPTYYWKLDEASGTIAHDIMGLSDGLVQGNTEWHPEGGHHAGALRCNGNDAHVGLGSCDITTGNGQGFTIACWCRPEIVTGTERVLMAKARSTTDALWSLSLVNNTGARFRLRTGGTLHVVDIPNSSLFSNAWYHLTGVYDGTQMLFYLNGSLTAFGDAAGSIQTDADMPASLASLPDRSLPFYGLLDDVRIYGTALDPGEVVQLVIADVPTGLPDALGAVLINGRVLLPPGGWERLRVFDGSGRLVADARPLPDGTFEASGLSAGIHVVQAIDGTRVRSGRLLVD